MLLKKSTLALCVNCNGLVRDAPLAAPITSWRRYHQDCQGSPTARKSPHGARQYATVHSSSEIPHSSGDFTPKRTIPWPVKPDPTPYDIFGLARGDPYNKSRFYELVKLYHPDRLRHNSHDGLPDPAKLDRYRLVVAANNILSNPIKRRLYDLHGIGWVDGTDNRRSDRKVDREWRNKPGNASMNATWEDWERWHQEKEGKTPEPVYMSNGGFAAIIAVIVVIGAWGQATRAGNHSKSLVELRDEVHQGVSSDLRKSKIEKSNMSREGRVDTFLRQREGWEYDQPCGPVHTSHERAVAPTVK